jgi:gliding motility-associated-like protein
MKKLLYTFFALSLGLKAQSQVVINEVMVMPGTNYGVPTGDNTNANIQSLLNNTGTGQEWIELYNKNGCDSADISCFILGSNTSDGTNYGAYSFPIGTKIPPHGFITIGAGPNVDVNLFNERLTNNICYNNRWHLNNGNGYIALYDPTGNPLDAIYWATNANNINTGGEFDNVLCSPGGPCTPAVLGMAKDITSIVYIGDCSSSAVGAAFIGKTVSRSVDGGSVWSLGSNATQGSCNGICQPIGASIGLTITTTGTSCGQDTGKAIVTVTSGTGPFTYSINGGAPQADSVFINLTAGNYTLQVFASGCAKDTFFTINQIGVGPVIDSLKIIQPGCTSSGSVIIYATPAGTLQYALNGGALQSDSIFVNLTAGTYTITVSSGQCSADTSIILTNANGPDLTSVNIIKPEFCGQNNASFELNATGGNSPYSFFLNGGTPQPDSVFINQSAQNYWAYVSDANGCVDSLSFSVTEIPAPVISVSTQVDEKCDKTNGSISVNTTGGTSPYTYQLNGISQNSTTNYISLASGSYQVIVNDVNNCKDTVTVTLSNIPGPTISALDIDVEHCDQTDGSLQINVLGGSTPIQYSIDNGANFVTTPLFGNLGSGSYFIVVKDVNDCKADSVVNIGEQNISVSLSGDPLYSETIPQLVNLTATSATAVQYSWNYGNGTQASTTNGQNSYTYTQGGEFIVEVTAVDAFGCVASDTIKIIISQLFIPNIYTPNGDTDNNEFKITQSGYKDLNCVIFNRWGLKIFEFNGVNGVWDGKTQSGGTAPDGTYYYLLTATTINGVAKEFSGYITLKR